MKFPEPNITIPVDVTNPGQFFACCGLLELADRLWPGAEGWFEDGHFLIFGSSECSLRALFEIVATSAVSNTMPPDQIARLQELSGMRKKEREANPGLEDELKRLESFRRELSIQITGGVSYYIDWFCDEFAGGSRFKTWAGQQSVLDITQAMHTGMVRAMRESDSTPWTYTRGVGLPFNFDSDIGGQGSALDIGFSFDPLSSSAATRIESVCRPALELLCFIGLQRFRPREIPRQNRFLYTAWNIPLPPAAAAPAVCCAVLIRDASRYEFKLLYRTKYLKSFLPAIPHQGDSNE